MASSKPVLCGSIAGRPGRFGVAMHTAAYRALDLDYVYVAFGTEDTAGAVAAMRALGVRGLGVTMPHKRRIAEHLDAIDDEARAIGAVNTVVNDAGRLTGYNVDWIGAVRAFREVLSTSPPRVSRLSAPVVARGRSSTASSGRARASLCSTAARRAEERQPSGLGATSAGRRVRWRGLALST